IPRRRGRAIGAGARGSLGVEGGKDEARQRIDGTCERGFGEHFDAMQVYCADPERPWISSGELPPPGGQNLAIRERQGRRRHALLLSRAAILPTTPPRPAPALAWSCRTRNAGACLPSPRMYCTSRAITPRSSALAFSSRWSSGAFHSARRAN